MTTEAGDGASCRAWASIFCCSGLIGLGYLQSRDWKWAWVAVAVPILIVTIDYASRLRRQ